MMISIILPVLNEPELPKFLASLLEPLDGLNEMYEIIVVTGDRETKNTVVPSFTNVRHIVSYGDSLERAILLGVSVSNGDKLLVMDADGSHPVTKVPDMIKALDDVDLVVGSRFVVGSEFSSTFFRRFVSDCFIIAARLVGSRLKDPMSGFFAFNKDLLIGTRFKPFTWKTCLELELKTKSTLQELPICFSKRNAGVSKTSMKIGLKLLGDLIEYQCRGY